MPKHQSLTEGEFKEIEVRDPREIVRILVDLMQRQAPLAGVGNRSGLEFLASIVGVEEVDGQILLGCLTVGCETNEDILGKDGVRLSAQHSELCVQFVVGMAHRIRHDGREVYSLPLPGELLCLQRRAAHRVVVPPSNPPHCRLPMTDLEMLDSVALDISIGGISLAYQTEEPIFTPGQMLYGCRLAVPGVGEFILSLKVRNQVRMVLPGGKHQWRLGCEFVNASSAIERELQRYMIKIERDEQARK